MSYFTSAAIAPVESTPSRKATEAPSGKKKTENSVSPKESLLTPQQMKAAGSHAPRALELKRKLSGSGESGGSSKRIATSPEVTLPPAAKSASANGIKRPRREELENRTAPAESNRAGPSNAGSTQPSAVSKRPLEADHEARPPPAVRRNEQARAEKDLRALEKRKKAASSNPFLKPSRPH